MSGITTHVLDTSAGHPAAGVAVTLERDRAGRWEPIAEARTDAEGRARLLPQDAGVEAGRYRLTFDTGAYFARASAPSFYPYVAVAFETGAERHYHVPLLVSPFGYTTYRGS